MTWKLIGALIALALAFGGGFYTGRLEPELKQERAQVKQDAAAQKKTDTDQQTVVQEAKTYAAAIDPLTPLPGPVVRLCYTPTAASVPSPHPAGPGAHGPAAVPAAAPPDPVRGPDIHGPLLQVGKDANAQVAGLQDYIERVCQAKAP